MNNLFKKQSAKFVPNPLSFYKSYGKTHFGVFFMPQSVQKIFFWPRRRQSRDGVFIFTTVCLSVYLSTRYLKNRCSKDHQTWHRNVPRSSAGNPFIPGSKCQRSKSWCTKTVPVWFFALLWVLASYSLATGNVFFISLGKAETRHLTETVRFSCFFVLPGTPSAETFLRRGVWK